MGFFICLCESIGFFFGFVMSLTVFECFTFFLIFLFLGFLASACYFSFGLFLGVFLFFFLILIFLGFVWVYFFFCL